MLVFYSDGDAKDNAAIDRQFISALGSAGRISYLSSNPAIDRPWFEKWKRDRKVAGFRQIYFFAVHAASSKRELAEGFASDAIFIPGGATFEILARMKKYRLLSKIRKFYDRGRIVAGLSAGAMIMTPTIRIAELLGDSRGNLPRDDSALGFVSFEVLPHFSGKSSLASKVRSYSKRHACQVLAFPDGSGIVKSGATVTLHGKVLCFDHGASVSIRT